MFLIDVNFSLALAFQSHIHHASAKTWFDGLLDGQVCHFCRMTQQGFLRLATNPKAFGTEAVTLAQAWTMYDALLSDTRFAFVDEPTGVETIWREYTRGQSFSPKTWNDAYLAAFSRAADLPIVTFDHGFVQYADLKHEILT